MKKVFILLLGFVITHSSHAQKEGNKSHNSTINLEKMETKKMNDKQSFDEYKKIEKALKPYIESARTGDGKLSRSAFYDHAHILGSIGGELYNMTADQFGEAVKSGGPSENVQHQIAWIDISGPAAAAKVEFIDWSGVRFTDFFVLYKQDGKWLISGKVYDSHSQN